MMFLLREACLFNGSEGSLFLEASVAAGDIKAFARNGNGNAFI